MAVHDRVLRPDSERTTVATTKCTKGGCKLDGGRRMPGAGLSRRSPRKAPLGQPAFQPYWGKLAVRNDRGDRGNVGIIRSPIRASILPDRSRPFREMLRERRLAPVLRRQATSFVYWLLPIRYGFALSRDSRRGTYGADRISGREDVDLPGHRKETVRSEIRWHSRRSSAPGLDGGNRPGAVQGTRIMREVAMYHRASRI